VTENRGVAHTKIRPTRNIRILPHRASPYHDSLVLRQDDTILSAGAEYVPIQTS